MKIQQLVLLLFLQFPLAYSWTWGFLHSIPVPSNNPKRENVVAENIIFRSVDGGNTWQDISLGLPENLTGDDISRTGSVANENGIYLRAGNEMYYNNPNTGAPFWKKEISPENRNSIVSGKNGMLAFNYGGNFLQKINGSQIWMPIYTDFPGKSVRTIFEAENGVFIGCDWGLYKFEENEKSWKRVYDRGWVLKIIEAEGVLLATSQKGIIRSIDGGENWVEVINEGGVGIDIERIKGGFAAISSNTGKERRSVHTSYDGGKTWNCIDAGLPPSLDIASITEIDKNLLCGHPNGIYRSSDKGKTWELILGAIQDKVFNLSVSGKIIYAIPRGGGC